MIYDEVLRRIEKGIRGENTGIPTGFNRLSDYIPGLQKGTYYLIGAELGTGKTAISDELFMFRAYDYIKSEYNPGLKLKIIYYSFEISKYTKITKAVCRKLYLEYGLLTDVNYVLSRGKNRISDEIYEKVLETRKYFEELEDVIDIYDAGMNPTGIQKQLWDYAKQNGKLEEIDHKTSYTPNNDNLITFAIFDHASLTRKEQGFNTKQTIDKLSQYLVPIRNITGISPVLIQQLNRNVSSTERFQMDMIQPQLSDFKDSGNSQEDADIVLALFSPYRYEIGTYRKYDINTLRNRFVSLSILKNREGEAGKSLGLNFIGEIGYFKELPKAEDMSPQDYERAVSYKKIQSEEKAFLNLNFE